MILDKLCLGIRRLVGTKQSGAVDVRAGIRWPHGWGGDGDAHEVEDQRSPAAV